MYKLGLFLYTIGSLLTWLIVGQLKSWHLGAQIGGTVALVGVALLLIVAFFREAPGSELIAGVSLFSALPIAAISWSQGASGKAAFITFLVFLGIGILIIVVQALKEKYGT